MKRFSPQEIFSILTGLQLNDTQVRSSLDFYSKCLHGRLRSEDFYFADNGTAELKLEVLSQLMNIHKTAKMIGDFNFSSTLLFTEKLAGTVFACMGFVKERNYFVPNTSLKTDIRAVIKRPYKQILTIFRKSVRDTRYNEVCYTAKGISLTGICLPDELSEKIFIPT